MRDHHNKRAGLLTFSFFPYPLLMLISYVIATYNRGPIMIDCLRQTLANTGLSRDQFEIIIADNASTDGTPDLLERELANDITLIRLKHNEGPVAKNHAIRQASGQFVIMLDDDAFPLPGSISRMLDHFAGNPALGAAIFDVQLPDGTRESSAYPTAFIGAGTGFRHDLLQRVGLLPPEFFMQAEEYDLSWRILDAGFTIHRFDDMPLRHLKSPGARIPDRTTRLDVRNNLFLLAKYIPAPLCHTLAADWLYRYWCMAYVRDHHAAIQKEKSTRHRRAFLRGAAEGFALWRHQHHRGQLLKSSTIESIFLFKHIENTLASELGSNCKKNVLLADFGKNVYPFFLALKKLGHIPVAIWDDNLAHPGFGATFAYREIPIVTGEKIADNFDVIVISNLNPVQIEKRVEAISHRWPKKKVIVANKIDRIC